MAFLHNEKKEYSRLRSGKKMDFMLSVVIS